MSDAMTELFTAALGLGQPWRVDAVRFEAAAHEIHFDVICEAKRLPCPRCAAPDQPIHDRLTRDWQHLHFFQYRALIHAAVPRVRCSACGAKGDTEVQQVPVPWARERSGFTLLFEAMVVTLAGMSRMPVRQIGALLGVTDGRLWRSLEALREHGGDPAAIERCTTDMAKSYIAGTRDHLANAQACIDPFHIVKLANEALEVVRRAEVQSEPALKRTRYHWLKDASNRTRKEIDLHWLRHKGLKTARAWRLKERLRDILAWRHHQHVPVVLLMDQWISWARRSRLPAFKRLAATFKAHIDGIRNTLTHANSNGMAESINADIMSAIARARGFRTFRNLRTVVYLLKGKLNLPTSPYRPAVSQAG